MEDLTIYEVVKAANGSYGYPSTEIVSDISTDTRKIKDGSVFIAIKGERFDGHDFAQKAMEQGAVAVITDRAIENVKCIIVDDTKKALLDIASYYRSRFSPILVGVTGSVGKTTTKEMVALVLSSKYCTLKTEGNFNNEIGLPHTLFGLSQEHTAAVIEMGMSDFGEISALSLTAKPTISVITNIGYSHIENLGSREGILKAKLEILDGASQDAPLILNGDDDLLSTVKEKISRNIIYYGIENKDVDVSASDIEMNNGSTTFTINYWEKSISAKLSCVGLHNVSNALCAFCVGIMSDIKPEDIIKQLEMFLPEGLRQSIVKKGEQEIIIDCYNASPDSMKASLSILSELKPMKKGRRIAVLGDMLELGSMSKKLHTLVGEYVAQSKTDILLCYGQDSKFICEKANEMGLSNSKYFSDKLKLIEFLKEAIIDGDLLLFKASRGIKLEEVIDELYK